MSTRKKKRNRKLRREKEKGYSQEFLDSIGFKRKPKPQQEKIVVNELPKTAEYIDMEKEQVIEDIFEGDLELFLKRWYRHNRTNLIYSKVIPKWEKSKNTRRAVRYLKKNLEWPNHIREVINLLRTLEKYYEAEINKENAQLAIEIWELFSDGEFSEYSHKAWTNKVARKGFENIRRISEAQAWKEQKARGFIHENDFEEFDKNAAHVYSLINRNYLYPLNFYHGGYTPLAMSTHIYIGLPLVGVEGFTRCEIPIK